MAIRIRRRAPAKKVFLDKQVDVIVEVFDVLAQMDSASSDEEKK